MARFEIGIVETRNVIKTIHDTYGFDFKDFALTSFKRRIDEAIAKHGLKNGEGLIAKLQSRAFFDQFLLEVNPETTEMFRDPSLWRALRDDIVPELLRGATRPRIWLAGYDTGEELYSLCILLADMGLLAEVQLYASAINELAIRRAQSGAIDPKKMELNEANYLRINFTHPFTHYYQPQNGGLALNPALLEGVKFLAQPPIPTDAPGGVKLALFRNQTIYYNSILQDKALHVLADSLLPGGFLALGAKETLEHSTVSGRFSEVNAAERIYVKKLS